MSDYGRPDDAPDKDDPILLAARYNDAEAQDTGFEETCKRHGLDAKTVMYIAEQRAMRYAVLRTEGEAGMKKLTGPTNMAKAFLPTPTQAALMEFLTPAYVDAIVIGWRAHELTE